jgi:hypothetical protein
MPGAPYITTVDGNGFPLGGSQTSTVPAGTGTTPVKALPGRLCRVVVTTAGTAGQTTFYDNASTGSGTVLAVIPGTATVGTSYDISMPAANGITAVGATGSAAMTVAFA